MIVSAGNDKIIHFMNFSGELKKKNQSFKKQMDYFLVVSRPLSLFKSSLNATKKAKRIQQTYSSFKKVKNLSEIGNYELPILANPNAGMFVNSGLSEISTEFVDGLVKYVCKPKSVSSTFTSPFGPNTMNATKAQTAPENKQ
jgi:hypothetical protein